jgi:hypothetical protein
MERKWLPSASDGKTFLLVQTIRESKEGLKESQHQWIEAWTGLDKAPDRVDHWPEGEQEAHS